MFDDSSGELIKLSYSFSEKAKDFSEDFKVFYDEYSHFQYFDECRSFLEENFYLQEDFFCSLKEASPMFLRIYLKKNGFPHTLGDVQIFIKKFGSVTVETEKEKNTLDLQMIAIDEYTEEKEQDTFDKFMLKGAELYMNVIKKYEKNNGPLTRDNFSDFLEKNYKDLLNISLVKDIYSGSVIKNDIGELMVVDFRSSRSVKLYNELKESGVVDVSKYRFLEPSLISHKLYSQAINQDNVISGKDISDVGIGIIIEGASCPIIQVDNDQVRYGDQVIDTSESPPVKFITSPTKSDYKLQSCELDFERN